MCTYTRAVWQASLHLLVRHSVATNQGTLTLYSFCLFSIIICPLQQKNTKSLCVIEKNRTFATAYTEKLPEWWNGRHDGLKIPWALRSYGFEPRLRYWVGSLFTVFQLFYCHSHKSVSRDSKTRKIRVWKNSVSPAVCFCILSSASYCGCPCCETRVLRLWDSGATAVRLGCYRRETRVLRLWDSGATAVGLGCYGSGTRVVKL